MNKAFIDGIAKIQEMHATIDVLLGRKDITDKEDGQVVGKWFIEELYHSNDCNVGFASSTEDCTLFPLHKHPVSKEYLICVQGKVALKIDNHLRIMDTGDCACIPEGVVHYSNPIGGPAKLLYVCIPNDINFKEKM